MSTISIAEAKNRLSELVRQAEAGEEIVLTRRGQPVARLAPVTTEDARSQATQVAHAFYVLTRLRAKAVPEGNLRAIAREGLD